MKLSKFCRIYPHDTIEDSVILYSTKQASSVILPRAMLDEIEKETISEEEKKTLLELGFLTNAPEEDKEALNFMEDLNRENNRFYAKVAMNLDCNLACTYCYEGRRKGRLYMSKETADDIIGFITNKALSCKEEIILSFYGGEPLLSADLIVYMSERIKAAAEASGVKFSSYITTNGTLLTGKTAERLKHLGLQEAAVTIDGPRHIHDLSRPFKTGSGSFDSIIRNVKESCGIIKVQLGGNFTKENYREMPLLLDYLLDNGLTPDRIPLIRFDPVMSERKDVAPPEYTGGCTCLNEPWITEATLFLNEEIIRRGYRPPSIQPLACMMELSDRLLINYDGALYKCPGLIGRKDFCVGDVRTGIKDHRQSHNLDNWKNDECLNCSYLPLCFGGCRYLKYVRDGNMEGVDCRRLYFDAAVEALVKQEIRYGLTAG